MAMVSEDHFINRIVRFFLVNLVTDEKPPQYLQIAKQNGLTHLHQSDFLMNYVVCVSQIRLNLYYELFFPCYFFQR
jgi:hypothetical protein